MIINVIVLYIYIKESGAKIWPIHLKSVKTTSGAFATVLQCYSAFWQILAE